MAVWQWVDHRPLSIAQIAFPDCHIGDFHCDGATLSFLSDGVFLEGSGLLEESCHVEVAGSAPVLSRRFNHEDEEWTDVDPLQSRGPREICEWSVGSVGLTFAGFDAVSGAWQQYVVPGATVRLIVGTRDGPV